MLFTEAAAPTLKSWDMTYPCQYVHHQPVAIALCKDIEGNEAKDDDDAEHSGNRSIDRQIANSRQCQIDKNAGEPEPEMGEEVHHGIEDDRRRSMLGANIL